MADVATFTVEQRARVLRAAELVLTNQARLFPPSLRRPVSSGESRIWCAPVEWAVKNESGGVAYRWKYRLQRIQLTDTDTIETVAGDTTFAGWPDVYALNEMEFNNQPQHIGYQTTGLNQAAPYPAGFFLEPMGAGSGGTPTVIVPCYARLATRPNGTSVWLFHEYNADNGSCT